MALLFMDGFDHITDIRDKWDTVGSFDVPDFVAGRFGGLALRKQFQNAQGFITKSLGAQTEVFVGFALLNPAINPIDDQHMRFLDAGGTVRATFTVTNPGEVKLSAGGQTATSATATIKVSQWQYIELNYHPNNTGGTFECRVDEIVVATITGDTTTGADNDVESIQITSNVTNSARTLFDDLYVLNTIGASNTAYLGDVRVSTLRPKANGTTNNFTPGTAIPNFAATNETQMDSDITFVEAGQLGAKEDYDNDNFVDLGVAPGTIFGVQTTNATKKTDAGTLKFKNQMVIAGTRFSGAEETAGSGNYFCTTFIRDTDPSDDATWTEAKVAAVGSGIEITFREV